MALTETTHAEECVLWEANPQYCRANVVVVSGQNLGANKVVGKISSGGKYSVYANGGSGGVEVAAGVLLSAVDASAGDKQGCVLVRGPAIVKRAVLDFDTSDDAGIAAAIVDLAALDILVQ
jgi:hypothetical protein